MTSSSSDSLSSASFEETLLSQLRKRFGYRAIPDDLTVGAAAEADFYQQRFLAHDNADELIHTDPAKVSVVTGFGPTNAPTAGTLSAMLTACELQRRSGLHTTIVISDLGAWNSRNIAWAKLESHRDRMLRFLETLGFDTANGTLRTHQDEQNLIISGRIARFLSEEDFTSNREALDELYQQMGLRGSQLGVMLDGLYTVADILGPLYQGQQRVLMLSGTEEHYFTELSKIVLARCDERIPGELFPQGAGVSGLYLGIVPGLAGYEKMSKSIPESAVHLGEPHEEIHRKIVQARPADDGVVLRMMQLSSGWDNDRLAGARRSHHHRAADPDTWDQTKRAYAEELIRYARLWNQ